MHRSWANTPGKKACSKGNNVVSSLAGGITGALLMSMTAYATGTTAITQPLENLKTSQDYLVENLGLSQKS